MTAATSAAGAAASQRCVRYTARVKRSTTSGSRFMKAGVVMYDVNGTGPVASPMEATRWAAPCEMSCSVTGCVCSMKSPWPPLKAATASGPSRSRSIRTRAGSMPCFLSTVSMHCHGVGASAKPITVLPDEILPREGGHRLPAREEESAPAAHLGEVDDERAALVGEGEAPHEPAEADLDVAVEQRRDRALAERGGGHHRDVEALVGEVPERDAGGERRVERRVKRHQHGHGTARHGWRV